MGFYTVLLVIHSIIVVFLIMMVLIQRTDSDGMGGLGGGGNQFLSGRTTANLMTRTTAILAAAFMVSSLTLAVMAGHMTQGSIIDTVPAAENAPADTLNNTKAEKTPAPIKEKAVEKVKKAAPKAPVVPQPE